jgi:hypothetical protein
VDHEHVGKISLQEVRPVFWDICICCCFTSARIHRALSDCYAVHSCVYNVTIL